MNEENLKSRTWFTADTHFGHINVIKYCNRPFQSIQEMDEVLINNINKHVQKNDTLYHLGDFAFVKYSVKKTKEYLDRIKCSKIILIVGNHDPHNSYGAKKDFAQLFSGCYNVIKIKIPIESIVQKIVLSHYAMKVWDTSHYGTWHLYGHSHYSLPEDSTLSIDVGVDAVAGRATGMTRHELIQQNAWHKLDPNEYRPISINEIKKIFDAKQRTT